MNEGVKGVQGPGGGFVRRGREPRDGYGRAEGDEIRTKGPGAQEMAMDEPKATA